MPRNSSGTFTLAAGNPVVTGNVISSAWANTTLSDIGSELTNSLDRSGRGPMLGALPLANGGSGTPSLTFASEPATGLFRNAAADIQFQVGGTTLLQWIATGLVAPVGLTLTQSQANVSALTATGNGTAAGVTATGGANNGAGISATGGGTSGPGVQGTGAASAAPGVKGIGGAGGAGGTFSNGTAATSTARQDALAATNGDISLVGAVYAAPTVAFVNRITPSSTIKAWASIQNVGGTVTVLDGFNVASVAITGGGLLIQVTFAGAMFNANYGVNITGYGLALGGPLICAPTSQIAASFAFAAIQFGGSSVNFTGAVSRYTIIVLGTQ